MAVAIRTSGSIRAPFSTYVSASGEVQQLTSTTGTVDTVSNVKFQVMQAPASPAARYAKVELTSEEDDALQHILDDPMTPTNPGELITSEQ